MIDHDPTDAYDLEAVRWREDREADRADRGDLHGLARDILDRPVTPMTMADLYAEKSAAMRTDADRFGHLWHHAGDWTHGDRWGAAS